MPKITRQEGEQLGLELSSRFDCDVCFCPFAAHFPPSFLSPSQHLAESEVSTKGKKQLSSDKASSSQYYSAGNIFNRNSGEILYLIVFTVFNTYNGYQFTSFLLSDISLAKNPTSPTDNTHSHSKLGFVTAALSVKGQVGHLVSVDSSGKGLS